MAKELPYFRFTVSEWMNDDVCLEEYDVKGFFIDFCAFYWFRDCFVTKSHALKRFASAKHLLEKCIFAKLIKEICYKENEILLEINFLKIQFKNCETIQDKRVKAGKLGGLARARNQKKTLSKRLASGKQTPIYKDKDNDKEGFATIMSKDEEEIIDARIERAKNGEFN